MADISSAAQWIGRLLVEEAKYLYKVEGKVRELRDELEWMQCFLRDADASQFDNVMARRWVAQIREFAYEAEDTIEKFLVNVVTHGRSRRDLLSILKKYSKILWEAIEVHRIGSDIDSLKQKMSALTSKLHTYGIKLRMGEDSASWLSKLRKETYSRFKEEKIYGRKNDIKILVDELKSETRVISICGDGGVGKTYVAKEIFHHEDIRRHFDAFAWASVSQPCQISAIQQELLSSLTSKSSEKIAQMTNDELKNELRKVQLKSKSLVVLDGIWGKEVWDKLKEAFPMTSCGEFQSNVLITTRLQEVAKHVHQDVFIHTLGCLDDNQSRLLLEEKIGAALDAAITEEDVEKRKKVKKLGNKMLKHCGGLPLAIVLLGGVLATKKTLEEWEIVDKNISSYLIDQEEDSQWKRILELSYYELPYQLKPCFLYLGYFPTNLEMPKRKITLLWEAEGLVSSGDDEMSEETLQDIAQNCLGELIERSLVQVGSRGLSGRVKTFKIHELMRDLCMSKASKGNWLNIVQLGAEDNEQSDDSSKSSTPSAPVKIKKKFRRLAIYCSKTLEKLPSDYRNSRYIRSLLFFNTLQNEDVLISLKRMALRKAFTDFRLLRVLDIEKIEVQSLPEEVGYLIHLRYLSLKGSLVSKLPSTIKYLRCLQTLDLRVLSFVHLRIPNVLWRMERLTHLYLPSNSFVVRHKAAYLRLKGLINLETLSNFSNLCRPKDVSSLTSLRIFSSCDFLSEKEDVEAILESPSSISGHLEEISLRLNGQILQEEPSILGNCRQLHRLWLKGEIKEALTSSMLPRNLCKLSLRFSKIKDDPMPILGQLSQLRSLSLENASFEGTDMRCDPNGFPNLIRLTLKGLESLERWVVEKGSMPKLVFLEINKCHNLEMLPDGLEFVKSLQELVISYMPLSFYRNWTPAKSREEWPDFHKVEHVPCIKNFHVIGPKES